SCVVGLIASVKGVYTSSYTLQIVEMIQKLTDSCMGRSQGVPSAPRNLSVLPSPGSHGAPYSYDFIITNVTVILSVSALSGLIESQ
ncbi:MAG: hypothetical protein WBO93_09230, partial [Gammaproteobacteria bacterium]